WQPRGVRDVGQQLTGHLDTPQVGRVVQRRERGELLDVRHDLLVHDDRPGVAPSALDHPVPHRDDPGVGQPRAHRPEQLQHPPQPAAVVGDGLDEGGVLSPEGVPQPPHVLPDALDETGGDDDARVGLDELVLDRGRAGVDDEDGPVHCCSSPAWAWIAVMATVLTMSWTRAPRDRSLTGLFRPWRTGPMATAPAERWTAL